MEPHLHAVEGGRSAEVDGGLLPAGRAAAVAGGAAGPGETVGPEAVLDAAVEQLGRVGAAAPAGIGGDRPAGGQVGASGVGDRAEDLGIGARDAVGVGDVDPHPVVGAGHEAAQAAALRVVGQAVLRRAAAALGPGAAGVGGDLDDAVAVAVGVVGDRKADVDLGLPGLDRRRAQGYRVRRRGQSVDRADDLRIGAGDAVRVHEGEPQVVVGVGGEAAEGVGAPFRGPRDLPWRRDVERAAGSKAELDNGPAVAVVVASERHLAGQPGRRRRCRRRRTRRGGVSCPGGGREGQEQTREQADPSEHGCRHAVPPPVRLRPVWPVPLEPFGGPAVSGSSVASGRERRRGGTRDPRLCAPGLRRVCLCRGAIDCSPAGT